MKSNSFLSRLSLGIVLFALSGCQETRVDLGKKAPDLPDISQSFVGQAGASRHWQWHRMITHFHSPYSFDACDGNGLVRGAAHGTHLTEVTPNEKYVGSMLNAVCANRMDSLYLSDHNENFLDASFEALMFTHDQKLWVMKDGPVARRVVCGNGHEGLLIPGVEGRLLGLGMTRHYADQREDRNWVYWHDRPRSVEILRKKTDAVVIIPHTESRPIDLIEELQPDGIEIYNTHANFDPNIRKNDLKTARFSHLWSFPNYLMDRYHSLFADFLFLEFIEFFPVYFEKWNQSVARGMKLVGLGGSDAHENVFVQKLRDGERLDSYRRMSRFISHHALIRPTQDPLDRYLASKEALRKGRLFLVVEGLGTPIGLDLFVKSENRIFEMGDFLSVTDHAELELRIPTVDLTALGVGASTEQPELFAEVIHVNPQGEETVNGVMHIREGVRPGGSVRLRVTHLQPGAYRAQIKIVPSHLRSWVHGGNLIDRARLWIVSNFIFVGNKLMSAPNEKSLKILKN